MSTLITERLTLRRWSDADRPAFRALNADPAVMATIGPPLDATQSDAMLDRIEAHFEAHGYGLWCVDLEGEPLGFTGLSRPWFRDGVEIGWRLRSEHWGHGYAPEAATECLRFALTELGLDEVISFTAVTNHKSRRVMEKIGLTHDPAGDFDHPSVADSSPLRAHVLYRITRSEWELRSQP